MMIRPIIYLRGETVFTSDEWWDTHGKGTNSSTYAACAMCDLMFLGPGEGNSCLVVGSPVFEAKAIEAQGWDMTYLDVRKPSVAMKKFLQADAVSIPFLSDSFDAVTSNCVLPHVGLGRYGDAVVENGDEIALGEMCRLTKPGGLVVICFGGMMSLPLTIVLGNWHRIYSPQDLRRMIINSGMEVLAISLYSQAKKLWLSDLDDMSTDFDARRTDFLCVKMRKPL